MCNGAQAHRTLRRSNGQIMVTIFPGYHNLSHTWRLPRCTISLNELKTRKKPFRVNDWILTTGVMRRVAKGEGHLDPPKYVERIAWAQQQGRLLAAVAQDWMCEPFVLETTGSTVVEHQNKTTDRYMLLQELLCKNDLNTYLMPVVQGWTAADYTRHAKTLSTVVEPDAWVGVGTVCLRQGSADGVADILEAILNVAPSWKLHGFGLSLSLLRNVRVRRCFWSIESFAWLSPHCREYPQFCDWESILRWLKHATSVANGSDVEQRPLLW